MQSEAEYKSMPAREVGCRIAEMPHGGSVLTCAVYQSFNDIQRGNSDDVVFNCKYTPGEYVYSPNDFKEIRADFDNLWGSI